MAIMNTAPKAVQPAGPAGPTRPSNTPAAAPGKVKPKKQPPRGNIGRMLREKL